MSDKELVDELVASSIEGDKETTKEIPVLPQEPTKLIPLEIKSEEFYKQPDSFYIRIQWLPEEQGYKFQVWNELLGNEDLAEGAKLVLALGRGMVECCIQDPRYFYMTGLKAMQLDMLSDSLSEERQKMALHGEMTGEA